MEEVILLPTLSADHFPSQICCALLYHIFKYNLLSMQLLEAVRKEDRTLSIVAFVYFFIQTSLISNEYYSCFYL